MKSSIRNIAYLLICSTLLLTGGFTLQSKNAFAAEVIAQDATANHSPTGTPANETMDEDSVLEGQVTGSDPDGDPLTFAVGRPPSHGSLKFNTNGTYTYTPAPNYSGSDEFYFKANDGTTMSGGTLVSISINNINDAPWSVPKTISTLEDVNITSKIIGMDWDTEKNFTYFITTAPANGALSINSSTGEYLYTPNPGFSGTDSFIFKVYDGGLYSEPVTITILITSLNDAPTVKSSEVSVDTDAVLEGSLNGTDPDGDALTFIQISDPAHGHLNINPATGAYTYSPEAGYIGQDSFTYAVSDETITSAPATVTITVNPANLAPTAIAASGSTMKGKALKGTLSGTDEDAGTTLTFALATKPEHGKVKIDAATGTYKYKPSAGFTGTDSFTFMVSDGTLTSAEATVSITVEPKKTKGSQQRGEGKISLSFNELTS